MGTFARTEQVRWCSPCRSEQLFEVPPCADGHGEQCSDVACTACGAALVVGVLLAREVVVVEVAAA